MQNTDQIIRTKLHKPFTRVELVQRPRLTDLVSFGLRGPLTLITAPAGFGKTTLAAASVSTCGKPIGWLSLDKDDNQACCFTAYLVAAVNEATKQVSNETTELASSMLQTPAEAVITSLINDLDAAADDIVLVLDDYQFITNPSCHSQMAFLLEHLPANLHVLIATRSDPPLPLARLRARGQLVELRTADLRFTPSETSLFLTDVMGLHLEPASIDVLEERTEGWIAGLQMAALSMRDSKDVHGFIAGFSGTNRFILDYLVEEVLATQPPEIQRFLLYTSVLERLTAPLCDDLLAIERSDAPNSSESQPVSSLPEFPSSSSILEYLDRKNLFLVALDDEHLWFRYHHLFTDLLRVHLHRTRPDLVPGLHVQASQWFEQKGLVPEAIQHLFAANELGRAADLIEPYGPVRWAASDPSIVQMADSLPNDILIARPKLGLYESWLLICRGETAKAIQLMQDIAKHLDASAPQTGTRWMRTIIYVAIAFLKGPSHVPGFDPIRDYSLLEEIPSEELILRNAADILYGMLLGRMGETELAIQTALRNIDRERITHGRMAIPTLAPFLSRIHLMLGQLHAADALCHEFLDPIREKNIRFISTAGSLEIHQGEVYLEWNRLDEAEKLIQDGLRANEPWKNIMTDGFGLTALVRVLIAKGAIDGAMQAMERLETRMRESSHPPEFNEELNTLPARLLLAKSDLQAAADWAKRVESRKDLPIDIKHYGLTLARVFLAQARFSDVEKALAGFEPPITSGNQVARILERDLMLAAAYAGLQRTTEALELVDACLAVAEPEGYVNTILAIGEPVRELLLIYVRSSAPAHASYARTLLEAFQLPFNPRPESPQAFGLIDPLTERELEVLQLLATGQTNQEIARQLIVANGTVKAHTASIYRKLEASNRTEAVARARQLGILP